MPPGTAGELCTRGYSVMLGYLGTNQERDGGEAIDRGAGYLADLATSGRRAVVTATSSSDQGHGDPRRRDVYPREFFEEFLFRHPKIAAVQVVGVPDLRRRVMAPEILGQAPAPMLKTSKSFCKGQIRDYKISRSHQVR